jgi:molybdopterin synthase sulfur carrier subunit
LVRVEFLGPIGVEPMDLDISSLAELSEILKKEDGLDKWLENSAVAINDVLIKDKSVTLSDGDKISLLPPVCGG